MSTPSPEPVVGATAVAASSGAVATAAACCTVPALFPALVTAGFGDALAWLAGERLWMLGVAAGFVAVAWAWIVWRGRRRAARAPRRAMVMMSLATALLALAAAWPLIDRATGN